MGQYFFFAFCTFFKIFHVRLGGKSKSVSFSRVYVCVKAKLTLVSFCYFFFMQLPLRPLSVKSVSYMTHSQMLGKVKSGGGPIFKVVLEC